MVGIALSGINFLLTHKVVRKDAMEGIVRALTSVALTPPHLPPSRNPLQKQPQSDPCSPSMLQVKALQSFILLMNELDGEGGGEAVIGGAMGCVGLLMEPPRENGKKVRNAQPNPNPPPLATSPMVASSAVATFTQLTSILFDRASEEVLNGGEVGSKIDASITSSRP